MLRRVVIGLIAAGLLFGAWQWHQWQDRLIRVGELRIDPTVTIDPSRRYRVVLWEEDIYVPGQGVQPYREAVHEAIRELASIYPNVSIEVEFYHPDELAERLAEALTAGVGPDLVATSRGHRIDASLQVPIDAYLSKEARDDLTPAAAASVQLDGRLWAWPRWMSLQLWLHHAEIAGASPPDALLSVEQLLHRAEHLDRHGVDVIAYNALDAHLLTGIIAASTGRPLLVDGQIQWSEEEIAAAASFLQQLVTAGYASAAPDQVSRTRLAAFWEQKAGGIAPANHLLLHHAFNRLGELTQEEAGTVTTGPPSKLVVTAPPHLGTSLLGVEGEVAAYAVLLRPNHPGDDHTQAVMRVAEHLSRRLGVGLASRLLGVPAYASAIPQWEVGSGLPAPHRTQLLSLSERLVPAPVDREWSEIEAELREKVIAPRLPGLLSRQTTPEEFATTLLREMQALLGTRKESA